MHNTIKYLMVKQLSPKRYNWFQRHSQARYYEKQFLSIPHLEEMNEIEVINSAVEKSQDE